MSGKTHLTAGGIEIVTRPNTDENLRHVYVRKDLHAELVGQHWKASADGYRFAFYRDKVEDASEFPKSFEEVSLQVVEASNVGATLLRIQIRDDLHAILMGQQWKEYDDSRVAAYKVSSQGQVPLTEAGADGCPRR